MYILTSLAEFVINDIVHADGRTKMLQFGGAGAHALQGMQIWSRVYGDCRVQHFGRIGRDCSAQLSLLADSGIDVSYTLVSELPNPRAWILYDDDITSTHRCRNVFKTPLAPAFLTTPEDVGNISERCQSVRGIHLACHAEAVAALAGSARSCFPSPPCVVWEPCLCDGGIETLELLGQAASAADVVISSYEEAVFSFGRVSPEEMCWKYRALGAKMVVIRLESTGCLVLTANATLVQVPPVQSQVVDATGAGNSFCGGFLAALCRGSDPFIAACHGAVSASFTLGEWGLIKNMTSSAFVELAQSRLRSILTSVNLSAPCTEPRLTHSVPPPSSSDHNTDCSASVPSQAITRQPLSFRCLYRDGAGDMPTPEPGSAIPQMASKAKFSVWVTFRLRPNITLFHVGRLSGKLKLILSLLRDVPILGPAFAGYSTFRLKDADSVIGRDLYLIGLHFSETVVDILQRVVQHFTGVALPRMFERGRASEDAAPRESVSRAVKALPDDWLRFSKSEKSVFELLSDEQKSFSKSSHMNRGETPTEIRRESGSGQTFRGKFELDLNMTLPQLFGVISTLACPTAPIIDLESAPKVIAELISFFPSVCLALEGLKLVSNSRHIELAFEGIMIQDVVDFLTGTSLNTSSDAFVKDIKQVPSHLICEELFSRFPALLALSEFLALLGLSSFLGMLFTLVQFQRGLMYQPDPTPVAEPSAAGLPWEVCTYSAADGVPVQSWLFKCATEGQQQSKPLINRIPTIVYFHGNSGNISHRINIVKSLSSATGGSCNILLAGLRGYMLNAPEPVLPTEHGLILDADAAVNYIVQRQDMSGNDIILYGQSLGGAIAIAIASKYADSHPGIGVHSSPPKPRILGLIVENSFTRVVDVLGPLLSAIIGERIQDSWDSVERVKKITAPALYLSGARDILVPPSLMETLCLQHLASCPDGATLTSFPDGGHNTTHLSPTYFDTIARFVSTMLDRSTIQSGL